MELRSFEDIVRELDGEDVRFLIVDGMAVVAEVDGTEFRFVDLNTLIAMKEAAGRPVDLEDVRQLRLLDDES